MEDIQPEIARPRPAAVARTSRLARPVAKALLAAGLVLAVVYLRFFRPVSVQTHAVATGDVVSVVYGRGTLESRREADLGFDLPGRLEEVLVEEGDVVRAGQEIARLEADQYGADVKAAASGLDAARAALGRLDAEERRARDAAAFAQLESRRIAELAEAGAATVAERDAAESRVRLADADVDRVLAQRVEAARTITVSSRGVDQRRTALLRATLLAPFDGRVVRRLHDPGDSLAVGAGVVRIADPRDAIARAWIDETALASLHEGQRARVTIPGFGDRDGVVDRIGWEVDRATHEVPVEIRFEPPARFSIGQRADVRIEVTRRNGVVRVPLAFVVRDAGGAFVWKGERRTSRVPITIGVEGEDAVEVLSGVEPGDVVLTADRIESGWRWKESR